MKVDNPLSEKEVDLNKLPGKEAQRILKKYLKYDFETGEFYFLHTQGRRVRGRFAGGLSNGYMRMRVFLNGKRKYLAHRLAYLYVTGKWPEKQLDHINHDRSDNRFFNLREADFFCQSKNRSLPSNNISGHTGVFYKKDVKRDSSKKWNAYITYNKKRIDLGNFHTKEEAIKARKEAEKKHGFHENHGEGLVPVFAPKRKVGASFNKKYKKWESYMNVDGKKRNLGYYDTKEEALEAREKAEKELKNEN